MFFLAVMLTFFYQVHQVVVEMCRIDANYLGGVAPLTTDPTPTNSTPLSEEKKRMKKIHVTCEM